MGTNYYFVTNNTHIGKRVKREINCEFIFARSIAPEHFTLPYPYSPGLPNVVNEYGDVRTWEAFLELIAHDTFNWEHIGETFC